MNVTAELISFRCSVPLICHSLAVRVISFTFFIFVSKFWGQFVSTLINSGDFNPYANNVYLIP